MCFALELSPPPRSIGLFKIRQIANAGPDRDNFDLIDLVKDFKFQGQPLLLLASFKCSKMAKDFSRCRLSLATHSTERANRREKLAASALPESTDKRAPRVFSAGSGHR